MFCKPINFVGIISETNMSTNAISKNTNESTFLLIKTHINRSTNDNISPNLHGLSRGAEKCLCASGPIISAK
jgi:hypothetical protein